MRSSQNGLYLFLPMATSLALYLYVAYFLSRHETPWLLGAYSVLFVCYLWMCARAKPHHANFCLFVALGFRVALVLAVPHLSDDVYRFIWDGRLILNGYDPFEALPSAYMQADAPAIQGITPALYGKLNSKEYFTIYPPLAQFVFLMSVGLSPNSVLGSIAIMKALVIAAEAGTLVFLCKLLKIYALPKEKALLYALNPLVIIELSGNLHFEAFMVFFLLLSFYLLKRGNMFSSAVSLGLSVCAKLLPVMVAPLILKRLGIRKSLFFFVVAALTTLAFFLPLLGTALFQGMGASIALYFQKFEFNASLYYLVREVGFAVKGYNIIQSAGKYMAALAFFAIAAYAWVDWRNKVKLPESAMWVFLLYLLFATTVHPWYIVTPLALSIITRYRFVVAWSYLAFFTYAGYTQEGFQEVLWLVAIEYIIIITFAIYEISTRKNAPSGLRAA